MRLFEGSRRGISEVPFSERYTSGQELQLLDRGKLLTTALVTTYDPTADTGGWGSSPNHWHVALKDAQSELWYPAAIWDYKPDEIHNHVRKEHEDVETYNQLHPDSPEFLAFSVRAMVERVEIISMQVTHLLVKPPETVPIPLGPPEKEPMALGPPVTTR